MGGEGDIDTAAVAKASLDKKDRIIAGETANRRQHRLSDERWQAEWNAKQKR